MELTEPTVNTLFSSTEKYRVPLYQRHYVWNKRNWEHLWTDIEAKSDLRFNDKNSAKKHFTGAIVVQPGARKLKTIDGQQHLTTFLEIIDGQQRLTTFQIILCAIRDICETFDSDPYEIADGSEDLIKNDDSSASVSDELYKLLPREGSDRNTFQTLAKPEEVETRNDNKSVPIQEAYEHFRREIETYVKENYNKLNTLFECIIDDFKVVQIKIDPGEEPEKIFQTINGTGRDLDEFDLLRNNLFLRAGTGDRDRLYHNYWRPFEETDFWRKDGVRDTFLRNFLKAKLGHRFDGQKKNLFDLYQEYRKDLEEKGQGVKDEFSKLKWYSEFYQSLETGTKMRFYKALNVKRLAPFILFISGPERSENEFSLISRILESYTVRHLLFCKKRSGGSQTRKIKRSWDFAGINDFLSKCKHPTIFSVEHYVKILLWLRIDPWPDDHLIELKLRRPMSINHDLRNYIFGRIERWQQKNSDDKDAKGQLSFKIRHSYTEEEVENLLLQFCEIWPSKGTLKGLLENSEEINRKSLNKNVIEQILDLTDNHGEIQVRKQPRRKRRRSRR